MVKMKRWRSKLIPSSLLLLISSVSVIFIPLGAQADGEPLKLSGRTSHDVLQALVALDYLGTMPSDPTSTISREAIKAAERELGLPSDGIADQTLLDGLVAKLEHSDDNEADDARPVFAGVDWSNLATIVGVFGTLAAIIGTLGGLLFKYLSFRRANSDQSIKP